MIKAMIKNIKNRIKKYISKTDRAAITDAHEYSEKRYGKKYQLFYSVDYWDKYIEYHTTSEFEGLDVGYKKHCGPCTLTNLVLSIDNISGGQNDLSPEKLFNRISEIGLNSRYYFNTDFMHIFGGTINIAVRSYIEKVLRDTIKIPFKTGIPVLAFPFLLKRALET